MEDLKTYWKLITTLFICVLGLPKIIAANHTALLLNRNSTNNSACFLKVIPLQYEINIGQIKNSSDSVRVSCWVKIKAKIKDNDCSNSFIKLNSRNCKLDLESITVSKIVFGKQTRLLKTKIFSGLKNMPSKEFLGSPNEHTLQLEKTQVKAGDKILLYVPYQIELTRKFPKESWQGLYYYDPKDNNGTDLFNYFPLHSMYIFPILRNSNPFHRSTFKMSVARYTLNGFASVSNTDIMETVQNLELGDGWVRDYFRESPPMKIDQVALFILGGFHNHTIYQKSNNDTEHRATSLWTLKKGGITNDSIYYTLLENQNLMKYYQSVFNETRYPLNKIDLIVVPWNIFGIPPHKGNLGFVTSMKYVLSGANGYAGEIQEKSNTNQYMAREIALQWFGGIAQPNNEHEDFWLSGEALAYYAIDWVIPHKPIWAYPLYRIGDSYSLDMTALLKMMATIFSSEVIKYAVSQIYLSKTVNDGTYPSNFWNAIQESVEFHNKTDLLPDVDDSGAVTVVDIMTSWIDKQYRYPTIRINEVENRTDSIEIYQEIPEGVDLTTKGLWWVPVNISTGNGHALIWISPNNTINSSVLYRNSDIIDTETGFLFVNPNLTEHYDVEYSYQLMRNIIKQLNLNHLVIPKDLIKKQFYFTMTENEWSTIEMGLETTKYLGNEMDGEIWEYATAAVSRFHSKFLKQPSHFQVYFGSKISEILGKIGLFANATEDESVTKLRRQLLEVSHLYEVGYFIKQSSDLITQWMRNASVNPFYKNVDPEIRQAFYCAAVGSYSDNSTFNFLYEKLVNYNLSVDFSDSWVDAKQICKALTCVKDDDLLKSLLQNDSKLATIDHKLIQTCYQQYIPFEILCRGPLAMRQVVFDFWMKYDLKENQTSGNETEEIQVVIPWSHEPKTSLDFIKLASLENQVTFSPNISLGIPTMWLTWMSNEIDQAFDEIYLRSERWFEENL